MVFLVVVVVGGVMRGPFITLSAMKGPLITLPPHGKRRARRTAVVDPKITGGSRFNVLKGAFKAWLSWSGGGGRVAAGS